ncbi:MULTISPECIES: hydroxymethylglutaryl-CoA reductase (NADPH) [Pyrobaculum]|uniref:3-hydroxy-3-methylglutaryl coenzyme A reductase n=2 Tax=Pyrobaculum arsenaticum TaxID=121277 RepID=A4WJ15_PYRAR|nr:hydroxymethylglutaryl-CoA reductase (NADPH) [Pyrobaculum arsenaticum]ABP50382.1 3-hydroxy-3-methylglutaryl-coenzyme A reductase [Pyrobaculum arsenaticum DSM 13514]MCY0890370.1 hydroxymethylglutaryl-CoA reductase (NADPH) [Pyrobaculum arsenaticum]NYR14674.1 hydroxymethylglutaryl-CoA reductase (NADPH) [Pyrobaculum arsenaticum]
MFLMEVKLHELDKLYGDANKAAEARRQYLEKATGAKLENIGKTIIDLNTVVGRNIENVIGAVQIPVGVAGPLLVRGDYANGYFYVPLATTEGALVASVNRGAKLVTESGGARAKVLKDGMARAPLFKLPSLVDAVEFVNWVMQHFEEVKKAAESTTRHGRLKEIQPFVVGNYVWLRMVFSTGDAMGMNMATIAADAAARYIQEEFPKARLVALSGNMCVDKKPNSVNFLLGRGKTVVAEALIRREQLEKLGTTPEAVHEVNISKNLVGSALAHSYGFNAHFANIITAVFIATGQDVAQVVESSMGITTTEPREEGLYISVFLPSLEVGTVGGGTGLPTQREALELLGVAGPGNPPGTNALKFAEIIAAAVLAGELNLLVALARNELASAHKKLGRGAK